MPTVAYAITDPDLSEYIYHCMKTASIDRKINLSANELKYFTSDESMRRFSENETLDKRLMLLMRLGYNINITAYPEYVNIAKELYKVTAQYESGQSRKKLIEAWAKDKIFFTSSRELSIIAHMAAQNSHTQLYVLDYTYLNMRNSIEKCLKKNFTESLRDSIKVTEDMSKILLNAFCLFDTQESITGCNADELKVLMALYTTRHTMANHDAIANMIHQPMRAKGVNVICGNLERKGIIAREPARRKRQRSHNYMILDKGIEIVMNYMKYVLRKSLIQS